MKIIAALAVAFVIAIDPISLGPTNANDTPHADLTVDAVPSVVVPDVGIGGLSDDAGETSGTPEGELQCLLCEEHHVPDGNGDGHWFHGFHLGTAQICEDNPGADLCRACGDTSECHDARLFDRDNPQEVYRGRCHQPCAPSYVLRELSSGVTRLASSSDTRSVTALAQMINGERHLEFDANQQAVRLIECDGGVRQEWIVDPIAELLAAAIQ